MKRTRHLLLTAALLVSTFSLTAGTITSVSELSNTKLYHVSQPNHSEGATAWAVQAGGSVLKSNNDLGIAPDNNDTCQQFAFLSNDGGVTRFLYHPAEEKFICRDGSLSTVPADPVYLKEGAYDNTFVAYFDDSHYINVGGSQQMVIDSWNTLDGGNSCAITAVGEFDPSAVIGSIPVTAQLDGIWYRLLLESRQASVVSNPDGATKYTGDISVSSAVTFDGLMCSVTSIGERAFSGCSNLTAITLPEGVTSIGVDAFSGCSGLTSIVVAEGNTVYDSREDCNAIIVTGTNALVLGCSTTVIPEGVTSIGRYAFYGCDGLTSITLPESLESIGENAFEDCSGLTSINIPVSVTSIGRDAFYKCSSLVSVVIPVNVTCIEWGAFSCCNSLTSITIPENVTSIGNYAFFRCSGLASITIPESVTSIGDYAFSGCSGLVSITIPESVTSIGYSAFNGCSGLTSITIPESVTSIGDYAFSGCSGLTSITIPESVTSIGDDAFQNTAWYENQSEGVVYAGKVLYRYKGTMPENTSIEIKEGTKGIAGRAFYDCDGLASITIPESVTSIAGYAFYGCSLTEVQISSIEAWCNIDFGGSYANPLLFAENFCLDGEPIVELTIPNSVTAVKDYAFDGYDTLTSVTLPEGITSIGASAFSRCSSLTSVTLPEGITSIGASAFSRCSSLTSITCEAETPPTIGSSLTFSEVDKSISVYVPSSSVEAYRAAEYWNEFTNIQPMVAFGTCGDNLTWRLTDAGELIIEGTGTMNDYETVTELPWNEHRSSITKVTIKEGVTSIGNYAFRGCSNPTSITIPAGVTSVGVGAFWDCSSLTSITIPESVTSIGVLAFSDCIDLISIVVEEGNAIYDSREGCNAIIETSSNTLVSGCSTTIIPNTVTSIRSYAFNGCSNLASITIPEGVTSIGGGAFRFCSSLTSIILPEGVTSIGGSAFFGCSSLTSITIPEGVTSIGGSAFSGCSSLTSITIPESVTSIGVLAFSDCIDLISIVVEEGNAIYDSREGCNAIIETSSNTLVSGCSTTIIPNTVTSIGFGAFDGCMRLTSINIPGSVTSIGSYAFKDCVCLTSINLPESVTSIGGNAFSACSSLTSITIPEGVTSIGDNAFRDCSSLTSIIIPVGVTSIEDATFYDCSSLTSITIPESVTSIGLWAFLGCSSLTSITIETLTPPTIEGSNTFEDVDLSIPVYVPASSVSAYQSAECWSEFTNIQTIPEVITINQYGSATYCSEYALDFSEMEGLKAYAATGYNTKTGVVTLTRVMTSQPGMGLFLKGEPGEYIVPTLESTDDNSLNMLVGTVERTAINSTSDDGRYRNYRYTIKSGDQEPLFYVVEEGYTLGKGKAYLQIPVAWLPAEAKAIGLRFDDGATTDIEDVESTENGEQATGIYDLMGRKVTNPQKGMMYIVNGKKTIMN